MAESKEYSTIIKCSRKLEIALKSDRDIAQFLHEQGLLTTDDYDVINSPTSRLSSAEKCSILVTAIRDRVELHPRNYHVVVNYMCQNSTRYRDIIEILNMEYQGITGAPELCPPAAVSSPQALPVTTLSVMATPSESPLPAPNASPSTIPYEGTTSMMTTPTLPPVPNAALSQMRSPNQSSEGTTSMLVTPSPLPAIPNALRSPYEGTTSRIATPPPSSGLFSASTTQSSTDGATVSNDNSVTTLSVMGTPSPLPVSPLAIPYEGTTLMATPNLPPVLNAALSQMRPPDRSSEGATYMPVTPSPPSAIPNASPSPRSPYEGSTSRIATPPPSSGSFSTSTTQSSTDGANDNSGKSATAMKGPFAVTTPTILLPSEPSPSIIRPSWDPPERAEKMMCEKSGFESSPYLEITTIKQKMQQLEYKFGDIVIKTYDKLKEMDIDVGRFRARLITLPFEYKEEHKDFFQQIEDELEKESTVDCIWNKLSKYWNFLNYTLLENLIHHLGDRVLKRKMDDYLSSLKEFQCSTRLCDFAKCCPAIENRPSETDLKRFVIDLSLEWETCTLEKIEELKGHIIRKFLLPSFALILEKVSHGSLIITWLLPAKIASSLMETLENIDTREFCKEHRINSITVDGKECKYSPKKKYTIYLKDLYSNKEGKNLAPFKLALIEKEISRRNADEFTKQTLRGDLDDVIYKKHHMTEDKIGHPTWLNPRLILIEGAPGVGKTTFSEQFCHKWSQGQRLKDHTQLVLLPLRNNRVKSAKSVSDLFLHPHLQQAIAQEVESTQGEGVALLLEGWDELEGEMREKSSIFLDLVCGRALPKATIIVTSRPWASKTIVESSHIKVDQHIELLTTPKIQYDRVMREDRVKAEDKEKFKDYLSFNPAVMAAMHTPVTANIITEVFQWSRNTDSPLPTTMTQLYTSYTCKQLTQHFSSGEAHSQQSPQKIRSLEDLPLDVQQQLQALSRVAWEGILKQQLTFSGHAVKESFGLMQKTGELYSEEDSQVSRHFIHLTLQEFLASYHISRLPTDQQQNIIEQYIRFGHLKVVIKFFFGIVRNGAFASSMIAKDLNHEEDTSPFLWMYEINDPEVIREILGPDESIKIRSAYEWSPLDYYSVGYVISNSLCKWRLYFYNSSMGDEEMEMWCKGAMNCKENTGSEQEVLADFRDNTFSVEGLKWFVKLPHHLLQRIVSLDFSCSKLYKKALYLLSQVVPALSKLEVLDLSNNPIGEGGAVELMRSLSHYKTPLKELYLENTSLGEEDIQAFCEVLADNHIKDLAINGPNISFVGRHIETLETLRVYGPMSVDGCTSLVSLLKHHTYQLKELDIRDCSINSDGAVQLAAALSENKSVVEVNMWGNKNIGDVGAGAFGDMLRRNNTVLQKLNLSHCGITSQGCDRLAGGVRANSTLQVLDLSDNRIEEKGVDLMLISLKFNKILKKLVLLKAYKRPADPRVEWREENLYFKSELC